MINPEAHIRFRSLHRSVGLVALVFVLIVSVTGILLNHSVGLSLDKRQVPGWVAAWYYDDTSGVSGFLVDDVHLYQIGSEVHLESSAVTSCVDGLSGAVALKDQVAALCGNEILLLTAGGQFIERLGPVHGVPTGIQRLGASDGDLVLEFEQTTRHFSLDSLTLQEPPSVDVIWQNPVPIPASLTEALLADTVTWEKFILAVHSGRVVGGPGPWLADLVAMLLIFMALTGLILSRPPHRRSFDRPDDY